MPPSQTALDLTPEPDFSFERFERGFSNQLAVSAIESWPNWPTPILVMSGPSGTGKTHLGHAWAKLSGGLSLNAAKLSDVSASWEGRTLFLDNAELASESLLFAVMNMALNGQLTSLLMASNTPPTAWSVELPDLLSRLKNANHVTIDEHEDVLLEPIIRKLFKDQGRQISKDIVTYIIKHCDRSVASLRAFIVKLDAQARMTKSDITRAYVAKFWQAQEQIQEGLSDD